MVTLVALLFLRWAGEGSFRFVVLKLGWSTQEPYRQGFEAFAGLSRSLGSGLVNDVATRQETQKKIHQTFSADLCKQHWAALAVRFRLGDWDAACKNLCRSKHTVRHVVQEPPTRSLSE